MEMALHVWHHTGRCVALLSSCSSTSPCSACSQLMLVSLGERSRRGCGLSFVWYFWLVQKVNYKSQNLGLVESAVTMLVMRVNFTTEHVSWSVADYYIKTTLLHNLKLNGQLIKRRTDISIVYNCWYFVGIDWYLTLILALTQKAEKQHLEIVIISL